MFACCDILADGDKNLAFDCKKGLDGGGYCPPDDEKACESNYLYGLRVVDEHEQAKFEKESDSNAANAGGETEEDDAVGWIAAIFLIIFVFSLAAFIAYVIIKTKCCTKPLCSQAKDGKGDAAEPSEDDGSAVKTKVIELADNQQQQSLSEIED